MRFLKGLLVISAFLLSVTAARAAHMVDEFPVSPPPLDDNYFPCMANCHKDMKPNHTVRQLKEHTDIKLHHAEQFRWCLDCHDADDRDKLRLQSGEKIEFTESYRLCGQCHGDKYRDWKEGIHGKRIGEWNGKKTYLLCAHCHNPHNPPFKLHTDKVNFPDVPDGKPMPPPQVPGGKSAGHGGGHDEKKAAAEH